MKFETLKKAFPLFVVNALFGLLFIFILALIYTLHANADESKETTPLDWNAPGFMTKLDKHCPQLRDQERDVFEVALTFGKAAETYREEYRENYNHAQDNGSSDEQARHYAKTFTFPPRIYISNPDIWRISIGAPAAWGQELKRFKRERKQIFVADLIKKCPQLSPDILEHTYKLALWQKLNVTATLSKTVLDWTAPDFITALTRQCLTLSSALHIVLRLVKREELRGDVWTKRPFPGSIYVTGTDPWKFWYNREKKVINERRQRFVAKLTKGCPQIQLPSDTLERAFEKAYP